MSELKFSYDPEQKRAVLTFSGGRQLKLSNVTLEQAEAFREKHADEFQRRDCCLTTNGGLITREVTHG